MTQWRSADFYRHPVLGGSGGRSIGKFLCQGHANNSLPFHFPILLFSWPCLVAPAFALLLFESHIIGPLWRSRVSLRFWKKRWAWYSMLPWSQEKVYDISQRASEEVLSKQIGMKSPASPMLGVSSPMGALSSPEIIELPGSQSPESPQTDEAAGAWMMCYNSGLLLLQLQRWRHVQHTCSCMHAQSTCSFENELKIRMPAVNSKGTAQCPCLFCMCKLWCNRGMFRLHMWHSLMWSWITCNEPQTKRMDGSGSIHGNDGLGFLPDDLGHLLLMIFI